MNTTLSLGRVLAALSLTLATTLGACGGADVQPVEASKAPEPPADPWGPRPVASATAAVDFPVAQRLVVHGPAGERSAGVEVLVVERHDSPAVFLRWILPGGGAIEMGADGKGPRWPEGTLQIAAEMLTEGTRKHPGGEFAIALDRHGADLAFDALPDAVVIKGRVLSHQLDGLLGLIDEALNEAAFDRRAFENLRKRNEAWLTNSEKEPQAIAPRVANRLMYGFNHPYGSPGVTRDSIGKIERGDLIAAVRDAMRLGGSTLVVVGDVDAAVLAQSLEKRFGRSLDTQPSTVVAPPVPQDGPQGCYLVDVPGAVQTVIVQSNPAPVRSNPAWPVLVLANQVLGGSASSRLFTELRERRGLTYGVYSHFDGRRAGGDWSVATSVRTAQTAAALDAMGREIRLMQSTEAEAAEIGAAQRYLGGQFMLSMASPADVADRLAALRLYGLEDDSWSRYLPAIAGATAEDVRRAARTWMGSGRGITLLVGDAATMRPGVDGQCARLVALDAQGTQIAILAGADEEMTADGRDQLFALWAGSPDGIVPLTTLVKDTTHATGVRAAALTALARGAGHGRTLEIGRSATDWPALAVDLRLALIAALRDPDVEAAAHARSVLLDLIDPPDAANALLDRPLVEDALDALARFAFHDIALETPRDEIADRVTSRLAIADLPRVACAAAAGLEVLVSRDVWRVESAQALVDCGSEAATAAMVRAYRRSLVDAAVPPDETDLRLLRDTHAAVAALLLFDAHSRHQGSDEEVATEATTALMASARDVIAWLDTHQAPSANAEADVAASTPVSAGPAADPTGVAGGAAPPATDDQPKSNPAAPLAAAARPPPMSLLERDFSLLQPEIEALLGYRNADDRWYAADLLLRFRKLKGLRIVLSGLADDGNYSDPRHHTIDPKEAIGRLCLDRIAPLGIDVAQPPMLATMAGGTGVAKVIAVTTLKTFADAGSVNALRTWVDRTELAQVLELPGTVSAQRLAESAVDVLRYMSEIDAEVAIGRLSAERARVHKQVAFFTYDLEGTKLRAEVARRVRAMMPVAPAKDADPTPPGSTKGADGADGDDQGRSAGPADGADESDEPDEEDD